MIDLHSHILPGVDDGVGTLEESCEMARAAVADGVEVVAATPHVRDDYPTMAETMERLVAAVRTAIAEEGIALDVRPGGEIAIDRLSGLAREELRRFGLAGNAAYVLVEFPCYGWPLSLEADLFRVRTAGMTPVIAHPERNRDVQARPERLRALVDGGVLVQLTAASLDGRLGKRTLEAAHALLETGLAHMVASDAHAPDVRAIGMSAAAEAIGDAGLAEWLTHDVPSAIVHGRAVPERPPRRRRWRRLRRRGRVKRAAG